MELHILHRRRDFSPGEAAGSIGTGGRAVSCGDDSDPGLSCCEADGPAARADEADRVSGEGHQRGLAGESASPSLFYFSCSIFVLSSFVCLFVCCLLFDFSVV